MLNLTDLKNGTNIIFQGDPHTVIYYEHSKLGRGGAIMRTKLKNLRNGAIIDYTFKGNEKIEPANITRRKAQYLYSQGDTYNFMDAGTFDQFTLEKNVIGKQADFLKEGENIDVLALGDKPININLPIKVELEVSETEPGVRGDTAQGSVTKPAILETGAKISVPIFVKVGDKVRVNTESGEYVERVR